jgi:hypothetical protein
VLETVCKAIVDGDVDFLREGVRVLAQAVMGGRGQRADRAAPRRATRSAG